MDPYYQHDGITIYHGDCREVIPQLGQVDLVLTDPPYSGRTHRGARTNRAGDGGKALLDFAPISYEQVAGVFEEAGKNLSGWLVSFVDWTHAAEMARSAPRGLRWVRLGIWVKPNSAPQISGDRPAMGWESIAMLHSEHGRMKWKGGGSRAVWTALREPHPVHPAQKPLPLVKNLASLFCTSGQMILDPFCGSGTTLRAAKDIRCNAIGIEQEERYCELAANRLRQEVLF